MIRHIYKYTNMVKSFNFTEKEKYVSIRISKFYLDNFNLEKLYNLLCCYNKNNKNKSKV